jgi:hypothetical protein
VFSSVRYFAQTSGEDLMDTVSSGLLPALWASVLLAATFLLNVSMGSLLLSTLRIRRDNLSASESILFSFATGFTILALFIWALGLFGFVHQLPMVLAVGFVALSWVGVKELARMAPIIRTPRIGALLIAIPIAMAWVQALMPPIAMDALAYHLFHPEQYIAYGKIIFMPFAREALWPFQSEMYYLLGLTLKSATLAHLFHWQFYGLTAWAIYAFVCRFYSKAAAYPAALCFLFTPAVFAQSGSAYVDLSLAFYLFAALYAYFLSEELADSRYLALSGLLCGGALGTKYLGLGIFAVLASIVMIRSRFNLRKLMLLGGMAFLAGGAWYVRSWVVAGNPVLPFYSKYFGGNGYEFDIAANVSMGHDWKAFLLFLWNMTLYPRNFGGEILGVIYLMFLPFLVFVSGSRTRAVSIGLGYFSILYALFLFSQSQHLRFFLSLTPVLSVGVGVVISYFVSRRDKTGYLVMIFFALCLFLHGGIYAYRLRECWPILSGSQTAHDHLLAKESTYRGAEFLKQNMKPGERFFNSGDVRYFYYPPKVMSWDTVELRRDLAKRGRTIRDYLAEHKFEWIMVTGDTEQDIASFVQDSPYHKIFEYEAAEKWKTYRYAFYRLS